MKEEMAEVVTKAEDLYENLLALPKEIQIAIDFDIGEVPDWVNTYLKSQGGHRNLEILPWVLMERHWVVQYGQIDRIL